MGTKVVRLDGMTARRKRLKRKHGPSMSFDELVQKLWQPESGALEPKVQKSQRQSKRSLPEDAVAFERIRAWTRRTP
jgi:hypothetical protein